MSSRVDHKRSLSEINFKSKNDKKPVNNQSINNLNISNAMRKHSMTPNNKKNSYNEIEKKGNIDRLTANALNKNSLKITNINNSFIKKTKKGEIIINDDINYSSKIKEKNKSRINPASHRIIKNPSNNISLETNISHLANYSIAKIKKISEVLIKKNNNPSNIRVKEESVNNSNIDSTVNLTCDNTNSRVISQKLSQTPTTQKRNHENKSKNQYERNSKSNNNLMKNNEDINRRYIVYIIFSHDNKIVNNSQRGKNFTSKINSEGKKNY